MTYRVLHTGMSPNKGGIEKWMIDVYRRINKDLIQFDFLTAHSTIAFEKEIIELGGTIHKITPRKENFFKHYYDIHSFFKDNHHKYDAIHSSRTNLYTINELKYAKKYNISNRIIHAHSARLENKKIRSKLFHELHKKTLDKYANTFLACSQQAAKFMFNNNIQESNSMDIIKNSVDTKLFELNYENRSLYRKMLGIEDDFVVGHIGAFLEVKNHVFILQVFKEILNLNPNAKLLLIGDGPLRAEIIGQSKNLGINENIIFLGIVDNTYNYLQAMDAFLLPSFSEGFGTAVIEAQTSGLKCYVSENRVPNEVDVTGLVSFISLNDPAKKWAEMMDKEKKYNREQQKSKVIESGHDIDTLVEHLQKNVFRKLG